MSAGAAVPLVGGLLTLALVLLAVASGARSGSLERNGLIGLRTRSTRSSDAAWAAGHRAAYGALRATGWLCAGCAAVTLLVQLVVPASPAALLTGGVGYAGAVAGLLVSTRRADRAARRSGPRSPG